jgi:hypothetical protein
VLASSRLVIPAHKSDKPLPLRRFDVIVRDGDEVVGGSPYLVAVPD